MSLFVRKNPMPVVAPSCKECLETVDHMIDCAVVFSGFWEDGPNDLLHMACTDSPPSRKYPEGISIWYVCGRRREATRINA